MQKTNGLLEPVHRRHRILIFLAGADADNLLDRQHHDLAVADLAGARARELLT